MNKERVLDALRTLQSELASAGELDPSSREALQNVVGEIQKQVGGGQPLSSDEQESMSGRLHEAVLEFESEHPQLTAAVNQVAAALANLGI